MQKTFVKSHVIECEDGSYGLCVETPSGETMSYKSLFVSAEKAKRLCEKINRCNVTECEIFDIIEDELP